MRKQVEVVALLLSGGIDSTAAWMLQRATLEKRWHVRPIYVRLGTAYEGLELEALERIIKDDPLLTVVNGPDLSLYEQSTGFIPQRNVILATLGQAVLDADEVQLCAVRGEFSRDKHPRFFKDISRVLSYTAKKPVRVYSPFAHLTKSEVMQKVTHALGSDGTKKFIADTRSCYTVAELACGRCMSCFRRWVCLENCGYAEHENWASPPWEWFPYIPNQGRPPLTQLGDFLRAQYDIWTAYKKLRRRLGT